MASNKISSDAQKIMDALAASISKDLGIKKEDVDLQAFQVSEELLKNILENVKKEASKESDAVTGIATMKASYTANKKIQAQLSTTANCSLLLNYHLINSTQG